MAVSRGEDGAVRVRLSGRWQLGDGLPSTEPVRDALQGAPAAPLVFAAERLLEWDSTLVAFVHATASLARAAGSAVDTSALPQGARRLVSLALAVPPRLRPKAPEDDALSARVGRIALRAAGTAADALAFVGMTALSLRELVRGRARFRRVDLLRAGEASGVAALGIVALINFLIGAVLAFVGAVQLQPFGASIYVADLVAIAVTRELGPLMTGIVMAGRTGASFAAVLGTMTLNEEVDALRTASLRPGEFLVTPRLLATVVMLPALVAYADLMGLMGGMLVGVSMLHLGPLEYVRQTQNALSLRHLWIGLAKAPAFGAVVALTGCYYGLRCQRTAAAVGEAATRAVVVGIVLVVMVDALATVLLHVTGL
ncbi:MAG TPA: ABC transporter permease [Vicinamibacteria bacterium]|nr:ABC transporter permease [Vicinamibacteria bacterium]